MSKIMVLNDEQYKARIDGWKGENIPESASSWRKDGAIGVIGGEAGKVKTTAIGEVHGTLAAARELAYSVQALVDRFCGAAPTGEGRECEAQDTAMITPILFDLRRDADRTMDEIRSAVARIEHLRRELP